MILISSFHCWLWWQGSLILRFTFLFLLYTVHVGEKLDDIIDSTVVSISSYVKSLDIFILIRPAVNNQNLKLMLPSHL